MSMKGWEMKLREEWKTERSEGRGDMLACVIKMEEMVMEREREECK